MHVKRDRALLYVQLYDVQGYEQRLPIWREWQERFPVRPYGRKVLGDDKKDRGLAKEGRIHL